MMETTQLCVAAVGAGAIAYRGYKKGSLSADGAFAAFAVGALTLGITLRCTPASSPCARASSFAICGRSAWQKRARTRAAAHPRTLRTQVRRDAAAVLFHLLQADEAARG